MKYFSGFSLQNDVAFFEHIIDKSGFCVAGFSYGAIHALQYVKTALSEGKRIDKLQLISPAFFQTKSDKFKRLQVRSYTYSKENYIQQFIQACFAPYEEKMCEHAENNVEQLKELLYYEWEAEDFHLLERANVVVEIYLGGADNIIDAKSAREFFKELSHLTYIKEGNHFLLCE